MNSSYSITSKFQVTIPKEIREKLNLTEKNKVTFERHGKEAVIKRVPTLEEVAEEMAAKFRASGLKPATQKDIDKARHNFYKQGGKW